MASSNLKPGVPEVDDDRAIAENRLIRDIDFSGWKQSRWYFENCRLDQCRFSDLRIKDVCFGGGLETSEYIDCIFDRSTIYSMTLGRARFVRCSFRDVKLAEWRCRKLEFMDCVFSGKLDDMFFSAEVHEFDMESLGRRMNRYSGNDFSGARLSDVGFRGGVDLRKQKFPMSGDYRIIYDFSQVGPKAIGFIEPESSRSPAAHARADLEVALGEAGDGQEHALFSRFNFPAGRLGDDAWAMQVAALERAQALRDSGLNN